MDADRLVTLRARDWTLLDLLERAIDQPGTMPDERATWQLTPMGTVQVGPREQLNQFRYVRRYDIQDLLHTVPRFTDVPQIDLPSLLQQARGGSQSHSTD
jgi:hypothetical protein